MRRLCLVLAAAMAASLLPAGTGAAGGLPPGAAPGAGNAPSTGAAPAGPGVAWPRPDPSGPARVDGDVADAARRAAPGATLDLVVSLRQPAGEGMRAALSRLGTWSWAFEQVAAAGIRLPAARLGELQSLDGVVGIYLEERLHLFLEDSARLVNTARAWNDFGVTGKGVTVAVLDTGVDFTHPDLAPAMRANVKLNGFGRPTPVVPLEGLANSDTSSGHGTHVAGDVAARGTASGGTYRGLAPGADLVGIGAGEVLSIFAVLEGFDWILANRERHNIRVVNNSWGTQFAPFDANHPINGATRMLAEAGIVVVFANGNDGDEMSMNPYAAAPWVVPVAAGAKDGKVAGFSSHGIEADTVGLGFASVDVVGEPRRPLAMGLYHPAVTTTGERVVSTRALSTVTSITSLPADVQAGLPPDELPFYSTLSGTSMAAPETAGVVALVLEAAPELHPAQVRMVLQVTARPIPDTPFHIGGYGYTDASAAVELARSLHGRPAAQIQARLEELQTARDQAILSDLAYPARTLARVERVPTGTGTLSHTIQVPPATPRIKVVANGGTLPFIGLTSYEIVMTDAAGTEVGRSAATAPSGTTVLDVDLRTVGDPAFGPWKVDIAAARSLVPPVNTGFADDFPAGRTVATLISVFGQPPPVCRNVTEFHPTGTVVHRFQDDTSAGVPHPADPEYTNVGVVRDGSLGRRTPARLLAGTFGQTTTSALPPVFVTAPLAAPLTVGRPAHIEMWMQGPSEAAQGLLLGELLDVPPEGDPVVIGEVPEDVALAASAVQPERTEARLALPSLYTLPAGHRLGVRLAVTFVGTSGHTLYYDSDRHPSGLTITVGEAVERRHCPGDPDAFHR